jgi:predicted permease
MNNLIQDLRFSARMLFKTPLLTIVAALSMAIGIGANTAIFSLVDKLLLQKLAVREPDQLIALWSESVSPRFRQSTWSWMDYADYRDQNQVFTDLIAYGTRAANLGERNAPEKISCELVSSNYFSALGVSPMKGRAFLPEENSTPGAHPVAMLSYDLWQRRFAGSPSVIGQQVAINEVSFTVVGIAPPSFSGMTVEQPADVWVPAMMHPQLMQLKAGKDLAHSRRDAWMRLVGRLKPGVTMVQAQTGIDTLARQIREANTPEDDRKMPFYEKRVLAEPAAQGESRLRTKLGETLKFLMVTVGLILLIACANVANLLLARSTIRRREIAVRLALGATRARLVTQLLTESSLLGLVGGVLGLLLAPWLVDLLLTFQPNSWVVQPVVGDVLDARVLTFTLGVSLFSGLLFGLIPALQASRPDLLPALKDEGAMLNQRERFLSPRNTLVIAQVALSLIVLVCAGLFIRSLRNLLAIDPGFQPEKVLLADIELPASKYDEAKGRALFQQLAEKLKALPGIEAVTTASITPLSGSISMSSYILEGATVEPGNMPTAKNGNVGPGYHELMGISLVAGRGFTEQDRAGAPGVAIINETFARQSFPNENPVGKRMSRGPGNPWLEIVGVARDTKNISLTEKQEPYFYLSLEQQPYHSYQRVLIRAQKDAASLTPAVREAVKSLDPALSTFKAATLAQELRNSIASARMATSLAALFGVVALLLAGIGLYGVISYSINSRTREIGIRMALGAESRDVLRLVIGQGMKITLIGVAIGLIAAFGLTRLIASSLYNVSAADPLTFALIALLLTVAAFLSCYLPARRATKIDPMIALRFE